MFRKKFRDLEFSNYLSDWEYSCIKRSLLRSFKSPTLYITEDDDSIIIALGN